MIFFLVIILILCICMMVYLNLQVNEFEKKHLEFEKEIRERFKEDPGTSLASGSNPADPEQAK